MSDLYMGLVVLGITVILAVVTYNWLQERKYKREAEARFSQLDNDVLMDNVSRPSSMPKTPIKTSLKEDAYEFPSESPQTDTVGHNHTQSFSASDDGVIDGESTANDPEDSFDHDIDLDQAIIEETTHTIDLVDVAEENELGVQATEHAHLSSFEPSIDDDLDEAQAKNALLHESGLDTEATVSSKPTSAVEDANAIISFPKEIDTQVDFVAVLHLPKPASVTLLQDFVKGTHDLDKHKAIFAMLPSSSWLNITNQETSDASTQKVVCSIQLADRAGYISKTTLTRFQYEVDKLGNKLAAHIEWLTVGDPWRIASELDQFCIDVDKLVGFHIIQGGNGPFTGTKLRGLAEASGLKLESDGAFSMNADDGQRLFCMVNKDGLPFSLETMRSSLVSGISFQLDIPRVKNCIEVFNQMVLAAKQMESSLGAVMVDDHQKPVGEVQVEKVRQQLKLIHGKMLARGIVPGSETALRLFL